MRAWWTLILLAWLSSWTGCTARPVVLPDRHTLSTGITCTRTEAGQPVECHPDFTTVQIDKGYLREILDRLAACAGE